MLLAPPLDLALELRRDALDADWLEAELEPSPVCFATKALFVFNQAAETRTRKMHRWPYGWKGSASLSARATRHVFRAYAVALHQAESSVGVDVIAVIVGMAQSRSFQIESHRSKKAATY
ncbi:hypothetical protein SPRG_15191 [Saprolegnia parasitica CBS 223.65]|uniref:Uncharacterized protein n=1 Tax=Saprolegnia parasitica (strain CBS 223.65) TaxID=695850 RepID=A0A067BM39_SAPPC|nr:hypothetical protein SPRG_15191 [Saprolegnia parasitica CBS 223.65]KDO19554.1 hypothetical protein SPRG_15191 [Saprolegnia parasitica CBS 223.65]|eukprot:XP_012209740.1 hypothetical protein SPRG_15191 [Saprolegnia parasitica CBS 223.65]